MVRNWEDLAELQTALERKVELGREDMSRLFRRANAPIFAMSQSGTIVAWNEHVAQMSSIPTEVAVGKNILDLVQDPLAARSASSLALPWRGQLESRPMLAQIGPTPVRFNRNSAGSGRNFQESGGSRAECGGHRAEFGPSFAELADFLSDLGRVRP